MKEKIALVSVFANLFLSISKIFVGIFANSAAVLAEGIHSGMDVLSSVIGLIGIKIAKKPVDKEHPYGHYKFEVLSGLVITLILFITGVLIIYDAYLGFISPLGLKLGYLALSVMAVSVIVNEVMARLKIYYGKKENSISLLSEGIHSRVDVWASFVVLAGLILVPYWAYADSLLALLIGVYIVFESFKLGKEATDSLLDVSAGEEVENSIKKVAENLNIEISDLKTQKKGSIITANLKIKLPKNISVEEATQISEKLRKELVSQIESLGYVAIQIESHDVENNYFNPTNNLFGFGFGRGFGWQGYGGFKEKVGFGKGPEGYCVCPNCDYKQKHKRGIPCSEIKCPKCGEKLERKW